MQLEVSQGWLYYRKNWHLGKVTIWFLLYYWNFFWHLGKVTIWFLLQFFSCYTDVKSTSLSATHYHWHRGLHPPFCVSHYQRHRKKILLLAYCTHTAAQVVLGKGRPSRAARGSSCLGALFFPLWICRPPRLTLVLDNGSWLFLFCSYRWNDERVASKASWIIFFFERSVVSGQAEHNHLLHYLRLVNHL